MKSPKSYFIDENKPLRQQIDQLYRLLREDIVRLDAYFETDGTLVFSGDATVWDDIQNSLIGRQLSSTAGKVDYAWAENAISFDSGGSISTENDLVRWNQQFPHAAKENSTIYPHLHLEQTSALDAVFTLAYRIQSNNSAKTTDWTELTASFSANSVFTYTSGTLNQIVAFDGIDMTGASVSSTIQFKMTRTDNGDGITYYDDVIYVTFVDCHVEYNMGGSRDQYTK